MSNEKIVHDIKKTLASTSVNFLIGSGLSSPFLEILNDIETKLSKAEKEENKTKVKEYKKEYFTKCMEGNLDIVNEIENKDKNAILNNYKNFYKSLNYLLLKREDSILTKQVNIFTTNVDVFSEKALEETSIEFNDGFSGRFKPRYDIGNFKKSYFKKSLHYENTTEIPIFNILKLHGSLTWKKENNGIVLDQNLQIIEEIKKDFGCYDNLMIVNPTNTKFKDTVLNEYYYNLIRVYTNQLEKENSVLFVMGFSFEDKHLRNQTIQVANSNPTLMVYIFSHEEKSNSIYEKMVNDAKNKNIETLYPKEGVNYNLSTITEEYFEQISLEDENIGETNSDTKETN